MSTGPALLVPLAMSLVVVHPDPTTKLIAVIVTMGLLIVSAIIFVGGELKDTILGIRLSVGIRLEEKGPEDVSLAAPQKPGRHPQIVTDDPSEEEPPPTAS